ncbi:hypothetical protein ACOTC5_29355 [Achromobacter xylosoxidans]
MSSPVDFTHTTLVCITIASAMLIMIQLHTGRWRAGAGRVLMLLGAAVLALAAGRLALLYESGSFPTHFLLAVALSLTISDALVAVFRWVWRRLARQGPSVGR